MAHSRETSFNSPLPQEDTISKTLKSNILLSLSPSRSLFFEVEKKDEGERFGNCYSETFGIDLGEQFRYIKEEIRLTFTEFLITNSSL